MDGAAALLKTHLIASLADLKKLSPEQLIDERYWKFRRMGSFYTESATA